MNDIDIGFGLNSDGEYVSARALSVRDAEALAARLRAAGAESAVAAGGYVFLASEDAEKVGVVS